MKNAIRLCDIKSQNRICFLIRTSTVGCSDLQESFLILYIIL